MDDFTAQRNAANFRSITRSDPAVLEVLETSVHSTIYHYVTPDGADDGEWIKQKAEGPMFIVRSTAPEFAIFMLNRATLKNITIPLIKGEMKAKTVGGGMLQVARRGEKVKRGVWFSEAESLGRFEVEITRICGPPSQRPDVANAANSSLPNISTANRSPTPRSEIAADGLGGDGFSRLFAGLLNSPVTKNVSPALQPPQPAPAVVPRLPSPPQQQQLHQPLPGPSFPPTHTHQTVTSHPSQSPYRPTRIPAPPTGAAELAPNSFQAPQQHSFSPPPGQTVDDLLNSILGVGSPMGGFALPSAAAPPPAQPHPAQTHFQRDIPPHKSDQPSILNTLPSPGQAPRVPLETKPETQHPVQRNGDALPIAEEQPQAPSNAFNASDLLAGISSPLSHAQIPSQAGPKSKTGTSLSPFNATDLLAGIQSTNYVLPTPQRSHAHMPSPSAPASQPHWPPALVDSVIDALGGVPDLRPGGRDGFVRVLDNLVRNEPRFVDDIWQGYLRRMGGG